MKSIKRLICIVFMLLAWGCSSIPMDMHKPLADAPYVEKYQLSNGLDVYFSQTKKDADSIDFHLFVKAGSYQEQSHEAGYAHFIEHMAFNGSKHFPTGTLRPVLEKLGIDWGQHANAFTSRDWTRYDLSIKSLEATEIATISTVLGDWAFKNQFNLADVEKEKSIILEELRFSENELKNQDIQLSKKLTGNSHFWQRRPIGNKQSIMGATPEGLKAFYQRWYTVDNMALFIIAGDDTQWKTLKPKLEQQLGQEPYKKSAAKNKPIQSPTLEQCFIVKQHDKIVSPSVSVIWREPNTLLKTPLDYKHSILSFSVLIYLQDLLKQNLFKDIEINRQALDSYTQINQIALSSNSQNADNDLSLIITGLQHIENNLDEATFNRFKERLKQHFYQLPVGPQNLIEQLMQSTLHNSDQINEALLFRFKTPEIINTISLDEFKAQANEFRHSPNKCYSVALPSHEKKYQPKPRPMASIAAQSEQQTIEKQNVEKRDINDLRDLKPTRKETSEVSVITEKNIKNGHEIIFENGLKVVLYPDTQTKKQTETQIGVALTWQDGRSSLIGPDQLTARWLPNLLNTAHFTQNNLSVQQYFSKQRSLMTPIVDVDQRSLLISTNKQGFEKSMKGLAAILRGELIYSKQEVSKAKRRTLETINASLHHPSLQASQLIVNSLYQNHPALASPSLSSAEVQTRERILDVHKQLFSNLDKAVLAVYGDFDTKKLTSVLTNTLGSIETIKSNLAPTTLVKLDPKAPHYLSVKNTLDRSDVIEYFVKTGTHTKDIKQHYASLILSELLNNTLLKTIRENESLVYTIQSRYVSGYPTSNIDQIMINYSCSPVNRVKISQLITQIIGDLHQGKISDSDIQTAKRKIRHGLSKHWLNVTSVAFSLSNQTHTNTTPYTKKESEALIDQLTKNDIALAAQAFNTKQHHILEIGPTDQGQIIASQ